MDPQVTKIDNWGMDLKYVSCHTVTFVHNSFQKTDLQRFNVLCCHTVTFVQSLFHGYTLNRFKVFSLKNMLKIITKKIG